MIMTTFEIRVWMEHHLKMTSKILIAADQKSRRVSHQESLEKIRFNSEFILVKSFEQVLETIRKEKENISLIVLDSEVYDAPNRRTRQEAIRELKDKSKNIPVVMIGTEMKQAISSLKDGADGFIPIHWL